MREEIYPMIQTEANRRLLSFQLCGITNPNPSYEVVRKNSGTTCIEFVESGCGTIHFDDDIFYPTGNDTYILQEGHDQHYYSDKNDPWKKYFVNIAGELGRNFIAGYGLENYSHYPGLSIKAELLRIIDLAKYREQDYTMEYILILNEIFYKMRKAVEKKNISSSLADEMKDYIDAKIVDPFCIKDLCKISLKSESQTNRIFKKAFGVTPYAYLLDKRISLSKKMLTGSNLSLKEIARDLQFADEYYFSNVFKQKTGMRPTEYRQSMFLTSNYQHAIMGIDKEMNE